MDQGILSVAEDYGLRTRGLELALAVSVMDRTVESGFLDYRLNDYMTREVVLKDRPN